MEPTEIEKSVGDLEVAVDRLRSLYEQYFMGIEKLEPTVPRKDVDRRIYALRKEQIRNTALRFRFQMILQRYNVYQTHWQRICREIENGTYKRHLLRAERRFGDEAAARRKAPDAATGAPPSQPLSHDLARELAELDAEFAAPPAAIDDLDEFLLDDEAPTAVPPPVSTRPQSPSAADRKGPVWRKVDPAPPRHASPPPPRPAPLPAASVPPAAASAAPPRPAPAAATPPRPAPPRPAPTGAAAPNPPPPRAAPAPPPAPVRPPAAPAAAASPAGAPRAAAGDLPEARVRQIYAQYVEAKRKANESTAAITYEAVAKSLRDSGAKLREKHGKPVDFEVAVKDGKAILKPVIK